MPSLSSSRKKLPCVFFRLMTSIGFERLVSVGACFDIETYTSIQASESTTRKARMMRAFRFPFEETLD